MATSETCPMAASNETQSDADKTASMDAMDKLIIRCARQGDWETAKKIIDSNPDLKIQETSTFDGIYILDCGATGGQWEFFNGMLQLFPINAQILTTPFSNGRTILHAVAHLRGSMKSARALVEKCPSLTQMMDSEGLTPLHTAIKESDDANLVWYLTLATTDQDPGRPFTGPLAGHLLYLLLSRGYYDVTHFLLQRHPHLAKILLTAESTLFKEPALLPLARRPDDFPSGTEFGWLARCTYPFVPVNAGVFKAPNHELQELGVCSPSSANHQLLLQNSEKPLQRRQFQSIVWSVMEKLVPPLQRIRDTKFKHESVVQLVMIACQQTKWALIMHSDPEYHVILKTLEKAVASGVIEILSIYMEFFPLPLHSKDQGNLLRAAIENRQDKIFDFFLRKQPEKNFNFYTDGERTTSLHMVAKLRYCPKITSIAGAAFQMQKELQWFKRIEKLVNPSAKQQDNVKGQTPWQLFTEEHQTMRREAEDWMKNTSNSSMLVATLIATVVFAVAFTVPGGNNQETGTPIFLHNNTFMLFAAFDALALFSSINSLWMFLSILTARFAPEDFLETLPKRVILGLATLFLAIASSIIAFGAALSLVLGHGQNKMIIFIVLTAFTSVAMFAILQLPLFVDMVRSTYCRKFLGS